jgi:hypothetical protein
MPPYRSNVFLTKPTMSFTASSEPSGSHHRKFLALSAILPCLAAAPALADTIMPLLSIQGEVTAGEDITRQSQRHSVNDTSTAGTLSKSSSAEVSGSVTGPIGDPCGPCAAHATANFAGTAKFGVLSGMVSASASSTPFLGEQFYKFGATSTASEILQFSDLFTPTPSTAVGGLQPRDLAQYLFTLILSSTASVLPGVQGGSDVCSTTSVRLTDFVGNSLSDNPCLGPVVRVQSRVATFAIGRTIIISSSIELGTIAFAGRYFNTEATNMVDAANTGVLTIQSLTPGASFTTASGSDYSGSAAAVPEPSSILLLLAVIAMLGIREYRGKTSTTDVREARWC